MVNLSNISRLLAAQAFNKKVLEDKARARQAKIEAERREDLAKLTRRKEQQLAQARNQVEAQRIRDSIAEDLRKKSTQAKIKLINVEAKRKTSRAFTRVAKGAKIGVLTGFEARKDSRGRTIGISGKESKTRLRTKQALRDEIARQQKIAREGTALERFLSNEQAINQGRVSRKELNRQIADRKRRGLSKTPAQKRAAQGFRDVEFGRSITARGKPKRLRTTFGTVVSERGRARGLGSAPFADPLFAFGGRTQQEQIARGGTFGRRAGGASISSQLSFISQAKSSSTSARIGFAQGLLSNLNFQGSSQSSLLSIVGNKRIKTPKTFQATLREGVGFFTTKAIPVTKAKITKGQRRQRVAQRKAEDFAKTEKARGTIARQARQTTQPVFDLAGFGRELDVANLARGRAIEAQPRRPRGEFTLGEFDVSVQRQQAQAPREISFLEPRDLIGLTPAQQKQRQNQNLRDQGFSASQIRAGVSVGDVPAKSVAQTRTEQRAQAEARQDEIDLIRATPFEVGELVPATGQPSRTETFFPSVPIDDSQAFDVSLSESIGFTDIFSPTPTRAPKVKKGKGKGAKPSPTPTPRQRNDFDILDISSFGAVEPATPRPRQREPIGGVGEVIPVDFGFGEVGEALGGVTSGVRSFFAIAPRAGEFLGSPFSGGGDGFLGFNIDPSFDPTEVGRQQGLRT